MYITLNSGIVRHTLAALTFTLALAATHVAGATAPGSMASDTPIAVAGRSVDAGHSARTLDNRIISALQTSTKWRSNSFSIAGSRDWSRLFVLTSTSINVRLPIN